MKLFFYLALGIYHPIVRRLVRGTIPTGAAADTIHREQPGPNLAADGR